jgi:hypothetical protein
VLENLPREREGLRAAQQLERLLKQAGRASAHVFRVTTGDVGRALLTVSALGAATFYRLLAIESSKRCHLAC